ncbi:hypothetical protein ACFSHT_38730 [Paraburkholderia silviterrae]|nr:hypothetical protein [Paraburkholderia silviterrae]
MKPIADPGPLLRSELDALLTRLEQRAEDLTQREIEKSGGVAPEDDV